MEVEVPDLSATAEAEIWAQAKAMSAGKPVASQPAKSPGQVAKVEAAVEVPAEAPANPEPEGVEPAESEAAPEGGEPESTASVPDSSWVPEEHRATYEALPAEVRELLSKHLPKWKPVMLEKDYRGKTSDVATLKRKAAEFDRLTGEPDDFLAWRESRTAGKPTGKAKEDAAPAAESDAAPDIGDFETTKEWAAELAKWNDRRTQRAIDAALTKRDAPAQRKATMEAKSWEYRDTVPDITDEQFERATGLFARVMKSKGKDPYVVLETLGDMELALAPYVELVKRAAAVKAPEVKPTSPTARAAAVKGQGGAPKSKPRAVWETNGKTLAQASDEEILAEAHRAYAELHGDAGRTYQQTG